MPWKERYTVSDERSLDDAEVRWPDDNKLCVSVVVDLSLARDGDGVGVKDIENSSAVFGLNEGVAELRDILGEYGIKATVAVPATMARLLSGTIEALAADGHEIAAHGLRHEDVSELDPAEEKERLDLTTEILGDVIGRRPEGWFSLPRRDDPFAGGTISASTMGLLIDAGYRYMGNGLSDDIPHYWVTDFAQERALLTLPYYYHFDDQFFLMFPGKGTGLEHADSLFANWVAEFDAQYARGRYFNMTLHPHAIGWCNRMALLSDFLKRLREFPGVWTPTGAEISTYWTETYPASTHLRLEPSIWRDYPGSLS
jgi:peptidoglycan/xylan/chitin deacetylase (PgdA/CDA1 family)